MNAKVGNKRWIIVTLMLLSYAVMYISRTSMSIAGPVMMKDFNWSATQFGLVSTAFFIGYALTMMPAGYLADRFGSGKIMVFGILLYSLFTFLTPFGATIGMLILLRAIVGIGQGVILPCNGSLLAQWVPKKESATAQGVVMIGTPMGITLTMPLAIFFMQNYNWQTVFYAFAFLGPIWILLWSRLGKNKPELHPSISKEEVEYIKNDQGPVEISGAAAAVAPGDVFKNVSVWTSALAYFTSNYLFFLFFAWLPTYFVNGRGFTLVKSGYMTMIPYMFAMIAYPLGGILADKAAKKFGNNMGRKLYPVIGLIGAGVFLILGTRVGSAEGAIMLITISIFFLSITQAPFFSMPPIFSSKNAGKIIGLYGFCGTCAGLSAPILTGAIIDYTKSYDYAMYFGSAVAIVGALILLTICTVKAVESKTYVGISQSTTDMNSRN
ncbi:MFS transporter [Sporomusa acidovorans]|uniref:Sulfoacetate transporter SauU n=1 Tax=Sporomusa acidovorans (strain ATCC 49682 / DSM 3132 / Mol) TaxID=1123286 RepID=A0ABZ3J0B0_SPOA4|nr:MFS transporter [Sporomusa acidovorans]OZC21374.1 putative sulfoacetate transporter SauU [Sporomusa acidovorans DSM 3132]SDE55989.1 Sugar phosphate permease [Sporomusa acidovorans]